MTTLQKISVVISVFILAGLIYAISPILTPFLFALFLAYLGNPLVDQLQRWRVPRLLSVFIIFSGMLLLLLLLLGFLLPLLEHQIARLVASIPEILRWIEIVVLPWLNQHLGLTLPETKSLSAILNTHWQQATNLANVAWKTVTQSSLTLLGWFAHLLLIPVVTFYLLLDWHLILANIRALLPRHLESYICQLFAEFDLVLSSFFRGQLSLMLMLSVIYSLGLWIIGLNLALVIGLLAGFFTIAPYLGFAIGLVSATIAAGVQFQSGTPVLFVLLLFGVTNILENVILVPWLVGDRIGLHPVAVLFAIFCGGQLFGFLGVLLALPVAAILMVLLRHLKTEYLSSSIYQ